MSRIRKRGEEIRAYIIESVEGQPKGLISSVMKKFAISRQAVHKHLGQLIGRKVLSRTARSGQYQLCALEEWKTIFSVADNRQEDIVWRAHLRDVIGSLPDNAVDIWHYGFTEMFSNVVGHSESESAFIQVKKTAFSTKMTIWDRGVGIFNKIKTQMDLLDERHAALELTKGGLTTDPANRSGEGIFFTTRMFDTFSILSGGIFLSHAYGDDGEKWMLETQKDSSGTLITMVLRNGTGRTLKDIFNNFSDGAGGLTGIVVPVRLAQYGDEKLVSRSEARRFLQRVERFKTVIFDFSGVEFIGQTFADEVFRIFPGEHPGLDIQDIRASSEVRGMIDRIKRNGERYSENQ